MSLTAAPWRPTHWRVERHLFFSFFSPALLHYIHSRPEIPILSANAGLVFTSSIRIRGGQTQKTSPLKSLICRIDLPSVRITQQAEEA